MEPIILRKPIITIDMEDEYGTRFWRETMEALYRDTDDLAFKEMIDQIDRIEKMNRWGRYDDDR